MTGRDLYEFISGKFNTKFPGAYGDWVHVNPQGQQTYNEIAEELTTQGFQKTETTTIGRDEILQTLVNCNSVFQQEAYEFLHNSLGCRLGRVVKK